MTEELYVPTDYGRLRDVIQGVLDRDGAHDWNENARLAELIAAKVWNELRTFPVGNDTDAPVNGEASEYGRLLAARDRLIAAGADPDELVVPDPPAGGAR